MKQVSKKLLAVMLCVIIAVSSAAMMFTTKAAPATARLNVISVAENRVSLSWSTVDDADGYRIFRYALSEKQWKAIKTTQAASYVDTSVEAAEVYYYVVRAYEYVNSKAVFGKNSNTVKAVVPPQKVTGLKCTDSTERSVTLSWNKQSGATGYLVYVYNPETQKFQQKAKVSSNSCVLIGLEEGKSYKVAVKAYIEHGKTANGAFSSVLTVYTKGAQVPTNLKGVADTANNSIKLTWSGSPANTGYVVYYYNSTTGSWQELATTTSTSFTVTGISETSTYTYAVAGYLKSSGGTLYSDKSESAAVYYKSEGSSDNNYSQEMAEKGIFGYLFDPNEKCFYTASDPWQRLVGYNAIFDVCAPFTFIDFDTVRLDFKYQNKDWRIQLWKGQYGLLFYGAEVGVYTKPQDRKLAHYNCASDDELLMMEMTFLQKKNTLSGETWVDKFSRPYGQYWWCTGFIPGNLFGNFDILKLEMRITARDSEMLAGITSALTENNIAYRTNGLDIYFTYE